MRQEKRVREGAKEIERQTNQQIETEILLKTKIKYGFRHHTKSSITKVPDEKKSESPKLYLCHYMPFILYTINKLILLKDFAHQVTFFFTEV